ncbi:MAG: hypothetical protein GX557_15500 [Chloroflexi bacterium]|nr:hypothetical protein [Chloroflexota bacterium]
MQKEADALSLFGAQAAGETSRADALLEPVNLDDRIRAGLNALTGLLDREQQHRPHWAIGLKDGELRAFQGHGAWDLCHDVARALHALGMVEQTLGEEVDAGIWRDLADQQYALFEAGDNLPGTVDPDTGAYCTHLHNIREAVHGLTALMRRGEERAATIARAMVRRVWEALDDAGQIQLHRLPDYVAEYNHQPAQEGRAVDALVRYYRFSGDDVALSLARALTDYALARCYGPTGTLLERAGTHGHSLTAQLAGMADLALLTGDAALLQRVKAVYDVGMPRFCSSFGWSMESLANYVLRGESNNTGDLLRAALLFGRAGWRECYGDAERILRGHLLPSQVLEAADLPDDASEEEALHRRASRLRGGWSFPTPSAYVLDKEAPLVTYDITSGAVDGLCEARRTAITSDEAGVHVNLLFSHEAEGVTVRSALPRDGALEIRNASGRNLFVRIPAWASPGTLRATVDGEPWFGPALGGYLLLPGAGRASTVTFVVSARRSTESIAYVDHTIDWWGDQIVAMSPRGEVRPFFPAVE